MMKTVKGGQNRFAALQPEMSKSVSIYSSVNWRPLAAG